MSELAVRERLRRQGWAAPGSAHDHVVRLFKIGLPIAIAILLAYLAVAPLTKSKEISFILDKNKVAIAKERMRAVAARYRGVDNEGRPFLLSARSAVQATSRDPVVEVMGMRAQIELGSGPAAIVANKGRYNLQNETVDVLGPIVLSSSDGYRLETRDVRVDLNSRSMVSRGRVEGQMPLGRFSADKLFVAIAERKVALQGNARLHIIQGGLK